MVKKVMCLLLVLIFAISLCGAGYIEIEQEDTAVLQKKKFAEDRVLVALKNEVSLQCRDYSATDFPEVQCSRVLDLSRDMKPAVMQALEKRNAARTNEIVSNENLNTEEIVDLDTYVQILCLELAEPGEKSVKDAIDVLSKREDVLFAEPDYIMQSCAVYPNDPYVGQQWGIADTHLNEAWSIHTGINIVKVGVLDSGIDGTHPELSDKIIVSMSRDFVTNSNDNTVTEVKDDHGHGTHVAGIIAAQGHNGIGISGVAWNISLVSLKVHDAFNTGYASNVINAINYANSSGISILNYSGYVPEDTNLLKIAIQQYSGLLICSAGNAGANNDVGGSYPSSWNLPNVISVGALENSSTKRAQSNYGQETVDIFAPGSNILSCYPTNKCNVFCAFDEDHYADGYHYMSGTSMAAPFVTGVAALIKSQYYSYTGAQIKERILIGAESLGSSFANLCSTGGKLNAYRALHDHTYTIRKHNSTHHVNACDCGVVSYLEEHTYRQIGTARVCTKCSYSPDIQIQSHENIQPW